MALLSDEIESIITTLYPSATFILMSQFRANRESFDVATTAFPLIILDNMLSEKNRLQPNANILAEVRISITVFQKDAFDSTDDASNAIIDAMKIIARRIMAAIFQLNQIRNINNEFNLTPLIRQWNGILTGVIAEANWNENIIGSWCTTPKI